MDAELDLVVQIDDRAIAVDAKVVFVDPNDHGVGVELIGYCAEMRAWIVEFISGEPAYEPPVDEPAEPEAPEIEVVEEAGGDEVDSAFDAVIAPPALGSEPAIPVESDEQRRVFQTIHERLRGLTLNDQIKMAHSGDVNERVILERLYGKTVWEALLRNPRLTGPEVARIARMGALPRPLLEVIMGNGGWLQIPEVRRALLSSKRIGLDHVIKVLRMLPKHELKLAAVQTVYPSAVRDTARRLLRDADR
jgi:hypothetical protein